MTQEKAANFLARCVERAPSGWSMEDAIDDAVVLPDDGSNPMGQIICARGGGVYLAVQGYPSRRDDDGIEFWDDPSSWGLFLSREEQRGELAAAIGADGADELAERSEWE